MTRSQRTTGGATPPLLDRVRKRDGREVPFQRDKIRAAIEAAMAAAGSADPGFADEVAGVVELTLIEEARRAEADTGGGAARPFAPHIEAIQDLVERALMELGQPAVAKAYILYREERARLRSVLSVHRSDALRAPVRVRENEGVSAWSKGRIVVALMQEAQLTRERASEVAASVERRVFDSGVRRVTTGLVRELVAAELFERGWIHALSASRVVGLARHDLDRLLQGRSLAPWARTVNDDERPSTAEALSGELLRRHTLEHVLSEGAAELHRSGDLHVVGLEHPHQPLSLCVDAELLASGGNSARSAFAVLDRAAELARNVAQVLVLEHPATVLSPLARAARPGSPLGLASWLGSLVAVSRASGCRIDLGSSGTRYTSFTARLVEELGELRPVPASPVLYLEGHELEDLLTSRRDLAPVVERLFADRKLVPSWGTEEATFAGPGCHRRRREPGVVSCGGAVALNLPRLARRAGPFREELFQSGLAELVSASLELAVGLREFQEKHLPRRPGGLHVRSSFALVPVGLRDALLQLGDGVLDADQGARLLGLMAEAVQRFSREEVIGVAPSPFFGEEAAQRFAWLDARAAQEEGRQGVLFADSPSTPAPQAYVEGLRLSPVPGLAAGRAEAEALKTLPVGALPLAGILDARDRDAEHPFLNAWRRFEVLRRAHLGEVALELFPPQKPDSNVAFHSPPSLRPLA